MKKQILFLHGGASDEDYAADGKLVESLKRSLGESYEIHYPFLPEESSPDMGRKNQIEKAMSAIDGDIIIVAHSFGASMLLKYLSENRPSRSIKGIFLIATPHWHGKEDWKQPFILKKDFAEKIEQHLPIFLYHAHDDEEVPLSQLDYYTTNLPKATVRKIKEGGHQLNNDLSVVAKDITSL
jgi:predicted alpha/beta hydrolase family esterase